MGGTPPFRNRVVAYMKKELHRHHENAGTALELFYGVLKKLSPLGLLYTCRVDIEREKTTVFDGTEFTFWRTKKSCQLRRHRPLLAGNLLG